MATSIGKDATAYNEYTAFTTSTGNIGPGGPVVLGKVIITAALTGNIAITDAGNSTLVFTSATTAATGVIYDLRFRTKGQPQVTTAPSGGSYIVTWE